MPSRRHFLRAGAAAGVLGAARLDAQPPQRERLDPGAPVPPSIAALKSLRELARPITNHERRARLERARRLMAENRIGALLLTGGTSLNYFLGMRWGLSERLFALVLPAKGEPFVVCPAFEEDRAREQVERGPLGKQAEFRAWQEDESPYERVSQGLKDRGLAAGALGVEETVRYVFSSGVAAAAPSLKLLSATPVTAGCRMIKDAHELELMRLANRVTLTAYEAAWRALGEDMTQRQVEALVATAYDRLGFPGFVSVQVDAASALPHGSNRPQVIRQGSLVMMDDGCTVEGYQSDITRTFVLGKATDKMKQVFAIVQRAQQAALKAARPGIACQAVDAAARQVITGAGFGPDYRYFPHRVGHGIGMDGHEWPYLVRGNPLPLAAGMTFSDEPGIYLRGEFGVRLEDDMVITENGAELFTPPSPSLEEPFAAP